MADTVALYLHPPVDTALSFLLFTSNPTLVKTRKNKLCSSPQKCRKSRTQFTSDVKQNLHRWRPL